MGPVDIAVLVIVCVAVAAVSAYLIYRKVKHKGGGCDCGGGCEGCSACRNCAHCGSEKTEK